MTEMTVNSYKGMARRLGDFLETKCGVNLRYSQLLEAIAAVHGQKDWNTLGTTSGRISGAVQATSNNPKGEDTPYLAKPRLGPDVEIESVVENLKRLMDAHIAAGYPIDMPVSENLEDDLPEIPAVAKKAEDRTCFLEPYTVRMDCGDDQEVIILDFECMAEDEEHALEQAQDAYPSGSPVPGSCVIDYSTLNVDEDEVAEWVGMTYLINYDALSDEQQSNWKLRWWHASHSRELD